MTTLMDYSQTTQLVFNIHFYVWSLKNFEQQVEIESVLYLSIFSFFFLGKKSFHLEEMNIKNPQRTENQKARKENLNNL